MAGWKQSEQHKTHVSILFLLPHIHTCMKSTCRKSGLARWWQARRIQETLLEENGDVLLRVTWLTFCARLSCVSQIRYFCGLLCFTASPSTITLEQWLPRVLTVKTSLVVLCKSTFKRETVFLFGNSIGIGRVLINRRHFFIWTI